jgi:hypothetical protein
LIWFLDEGKKELKEIKGRRREGKQAEIQERKVKKYVEKMREEVMERLIERNRQRN